MTKFKQYPFSGKETLNTRELLNTVDGWFKTTSLTYHDIITAALDYVADATDTLPMPNNLYSHDNKLVQHHSNGASNDIAITGSKVDAQRIAWALNVSSLGHGKAKYLATYTIIT